MLKIKVTALKKQSIRSSYLFDLCPFSGFLAITFCNLKGEFWVDLSFSSIGRRSHVLTALIIGPAANPKEGSLLDILSSTTMNLQAPMEGKQDISVIQNPDLNLGLSGNLRAFLLAISSAREAI